MQLLEEGDLHQGEEDMVHLHTNRSWSQGSTRQENPAQRHEECQYLSLQRYAG